MTSGDLLALFRREMNDTEEPQLWSDDDFYSYLTDAQRMFCRKTDNIGDATTPEVVNISVVANTEWYPSHKSILKVRACSRLDTGADVDVLNREDMAGKNMRFDGRTGPVKALIIGMEPHRVRVWPVPNEDVTLQLLVFRLPLQAITDDQELEIDEQHHEHLLHWVKHRAYSKQDAEAFDKTKAADFEQKFNAYCEMAKVEQRRARHKPRATEYGGY